MEIYFLLVFIMFLILHILHINYVTYTNSQNQYTKRNNGKKIKICNPDKKYLLSHGAITATRHRLVTAWYEKGE